MFDNRSSPEQTFVGSKKHEENDELLVKVLKLTEDLPTSSDRLRKVAGFFIAGHGPRDEDIVVAHNFDCGVVESLKIAMTNIRSSYAQLKDPHEVKCARYEKDVEHILEEMNRQAGVESIGIHASGDVGLGTDHELPVVTPSSIDPSLLKRYNELYTAITRARRDNKKKSVKLMFSSKSEERVDKKDMVLFATFDPLEMRDGIGHYCVVALNVKERRFEFVDLLNKPDSSKENKA
ncbi:hypothetical protein ZWY2020_033858 [Hordeum vulgare]|nr:hypothetical protein ZWY2020_033858 [Hordeum vulgare]